MTVLGFVRNAGRQATPFLALWFVALGTDCGLEEDPGSTTSAASTGIGATSSATGSTTGATSTGSGTGTGGAAGAPSSDATPDPGDDAAPRVNDARPGNDGAPVEAGSIDRAPPDAAADDAVDGSSIDAAKSDAPSTSGCPSPALVCDDFESGNLNAWRVLETGGAFAVDQLHAYGGRSAVKLTIPANQRGGFIERTGAPLFPLASNTIWGRMMVYFESMASLHYDTIRAAPVGGGTPWYNIGGQYKALLFNYYSGNNDCAGYPKPNPPIPTNKWMCWEWKFEGPRNEMVLWIDGAPIWTVTGMGTTCVTGGAPTWAAPTFGSIRLGEFNAQTEGSQTRMWMDDIAIGTSGRIGCPAAPPTAH